MATIDIGTCSWLAEVSLLATSQDLHRIVVFLSHMLLLDVARRVVADRNRADPSSDVLIIAFVCNGLLHYIRVHRNIVANTSIALGNTRNPPDNVSIRHLKLNIDRFELQRDLDCFGRH